MKCSTALTTCLNIHSGDCKDLNGEKDRCVVGAINNYTTQLLDYGKDTKCKKNLAMTLKILCLHLFYLYQLLCVDLPNYCFIWGNHNIR